MIVGNGTKRWRINFGTPEADRDLGAGWSDNERDLNVSFVWSNAPQSELYFFSNETCEHKLRFRCWPLVVPERPTQQIEIFANGHFVSRVALKPGPNEYEIWLSAETFEAGENVLEFRYEYQARPEDFIPESRDDRPLAVAWDWLDIGADSSPDQPVIDSPK